MVTWRTQQISVVALALLFFSSWSVAQERDTSSYGSRLTNSFRNEAVPEFSVDRIIRSNTQNLRPRTGGGNLVTPPSRSYSSDLGIGSSMGSKPFSTVSPRPTVSPYLNLFREDLGGNDDLNYQTLVRPQLEQQRTNAQLQRQNEDLSRRVQSISAQRDYTPGGAQNMYPTGHPTMFNYHGRYYPSMRRR